MMGQKLRAASPNPGPQIVCCVCGKTPVVRMAPPLCGSCDSAGRRNENAAYATRLRQSINDLRALYVQITGADIDDPRIDPHGVHVPPGTKQEPTA